MWVPTIPSYKYTRKTYIYFTIFNIKYKMKINSKFEFSAKTHFLYTYICIIHKGYGGWADSVQVGPPRGPAPRGQSQPDPFTLSSNTSWTFQLGQMINAIRHNWFLNMQCNSPKVKKVMNEDLSICSKVKRSSHNVTPKSYMAFDKFKTARLPPMHGPKCVQWQEVHTMTRPSEHQNQELTSMRSIKSYICISTRKLILCNVYTKYQIVWIFTCFPLQHISIHLKRPSEHQDQELHVIYQKVTLCQNKEIDFM